MFRVYSVFSSVQGESTRAGLPCTFVRLAGCPLHCVYCDTRDACESEGADITLEELVSKVSKSGNNLVEVTGGEPLAQEETLDLLATLCDEGYQVMLETSGAMEISNVDRRVRIVMDVKCPGSGMSDRILMRNFSHLNSEMHELKFVVSSRKDFDWGMDFITANGLENYELLFSPVYELVTLKDLSGWILDAPVAVRIQPQLHKLIWPGAEVEV